MSELTDNISVASREFKIDHRNLSLSWDLVDTGNVYNDWEISRNKHDGKLCFMVDSDKWFVRCENDIQVIDENVDEQVGGDLGEIYQQSLDFLNLNLTGGDE